MTKSIALVVLLAALPGCPLLEVEVEIGEACMVYKDVRVDPVPAGQASSTTFTLDDLTAIQELVDLDAEVQLVRAELRLTSGVSDFAFIDGVHVTLASGDPESALPTLAAYDCDHCGANSPTLAVPASAPLDVAAYVASGSIVVGVDMSGQLPAESFTMDVDACVSGAVTYTVE